jgi:hypothetical protein
MDFKNFDEYDVDSVCYEFDKLVNKTDNGNKFYIVINGEDINKVEDIMTSNGYKYKFRNIHELFGGSQKPLLLSVTVEKKEYEITLWFRIVLFVDYDYKQDNYRSFRNELSLFGIDSGKTLIIDDCIIL